MAPVAAESDPGHGAAMQMQSDQSHPSFGTALRLWARIGLLSFGGPAGQIALLHRLVVEERQWVEEQDFAHALNLCMLLPGPEAMQLATWIGWRLHGIAGGIMAGLLFILPGALLLLGLSMLYAAHGNLPLVEALFFGLRAAVVAIIVDALIRMRARLAGSGLPFLIALSAFLALFVFGLPFPLVLLAAAAAGWAAGRADVPGFRFPPAGLMPASDGARAAGRRAMLAGALFLFLWLLPLPLLAILPGRFDVFGDLAGFFSFLALASFGGAYAALAWVADVAVSGFGWLTAREMLDGLGLAETTPGPLLLVVQFVGFLAAARAETGLPPAVGGALGAAIVLWASFMPCFAWIFLSAPHLERLRQSAPLSAALRAVTAAVVGVIANLALWFALQGLFAEHHAITGTGLELPALSSARPGAMLLTAAALVAALGFRVGPLPLLAGCALAGLLMAQAGWV